MIHSTTAPGHYTVGEPETDPVLIAKMNEALSRHRANMEWFEDHAAEIVEDHRGKFICVAGRELFVGDEPRALYARARVAHPDDWGGFYVKYIPLAPRCV